MNSSLVMLVYTSHSRKPIDTELIKSILQISQKNNSASEITGLLTVRSDYFFQFLEGEEKNVNLCFERISKDPRHHNITVHGTSKIEKRLVPSWTMGWVEKDSSAESLIEIFELGKKGKPYAGLQSLEALVRMFSRGSKIVQ